MLSDNLLSMGQIGLIAYGENCRKWPKWAKNLQNHQMVGQCCVQLSNGRTVLCPNVQWSDSVVSNCPMVGQCCVQLSNGRTLLCPNVQWSDSVVSNCPMVRQCMSKCPMVEQCCVQLFITSKNEIHSLIDVQFIFFLQLFFDKKCVNFRLLK